MSKITALRDTHLQKDWAVDPAFLDNSLKSLCTIGKSYPFTDITDGEPDAKLIRSKGFIFVRLGYGCGDWYINAEHWQGADAEIDEADLDDYSPKVKDAVQRQIDRLKAYKGGYDYEATKTKYFSQRDNYRDAHRTCNSSSNAMYTDWLLRVLGRGEIKNDDEYIREVFKRGDTIYHGVQTRVIKEVYKLNTKWNGDADWPFVKALAEVGFPVVCNILHRGPISAPRGGHIIMIIGYDCNSKELIVHDPYGTLQSNYKVTNGAFSRIKEKEFLTRWQGGYRVLA